MALEQTFTVVGAEVSLDLLGGWASPWADVVSHRVPLHQLKTALEALGSGKYELDGKVAIKVAVEPHLA